jgi:hypothetical protein
MREQTVLEVCTCTTTKMRKRKRKKEYHILRGDEFLEQLHDAFGVPTQLAKSVQDGLEILLDLPISNITYKKPNNK